MRAKAERAAGERKRESARERERVSESGTDRERKPS